MKQLAVEVENLNDEFRFASCSLISVSPRLNTDTVKNIMFQIYLRLLCSALLAVGRLSFSKCRISGTYNVHIAQVRIDSVTWLLHSKVAKSEYPSRNKGGENGGKHRQVLLELLRQ